MLTLAQISSVIGLLLAFGVPQAEVNNVQTILVNSQQTVAIASAPVVSEPAIVASTTPNCTVTVDSSVGEVPAGAHGRGTPVLTTVNLYLHDSCQRTWRYDYTHDSWDNDGKGGYVNVTEFSPNHIAPLYFESPVPGMHTATVYAHTIDGTATTSPMTFIYEGGNGTI